MVSILRKVRESPGHRSWAEDLSILEILGPDTIISHSQVADVYLLGLAVLKKGKLATLDHRIPPDVVPGGRRAIELISG